MLTDQGVTMLGVWIAISTLGFFTEERICHRCSAQCGRLPAVQDLGTGAHATHA